LGLKTTRTGSASAPAGFLQKGLSRIVLPIPETSAGPSLEECLRCRRSTREYTRSPLTLEEVGRLVWAAQGLTGVGGLRTAPSAGAIYPFTTRLGMFLVEGIPAGVYEYDVDLHEVTLVEKGDRRKRVANAAMGQACVEQCALALLLTCWEKALRDQFGDLAPRFAAIEAGHIGQNFLLQATALGLGCVGVGKFDIDLLRAVWPFRSDEYPMYMLLAGRV
jgi:SagB-type dehydrogenase family enzyme